LAGGRLSTTKTNTDEIRLFPPVDRLFILFIALEVVTFPLVPLAPLIVAGAATTTPLRRSRPRLVALWVIAATLSVILIAPFVASAFGSTLLEESPVHEVSGSDERSRP